MYITSRFEIGDNFDFSARRAVKQAFRENGYAPNEILVHPETDTQNATSITVLLNNMIRIIPIVVRDDLKIGFDLPLNMAILDISNPYSNLE